MNIVFIGIPIVFLLLAVAAFLTLQLVIVEEKLQRRIDRAMGINVAGIAGDPAQHIYLRIVVGLGFAVARSGLLSAKTLAELRHTLRMAGIRDKGALGLFVGVKLIVTLALPLLVLGSGELAGLSGNRMALVGVVAAIIGLISPDIVIKQRRKRFLQRVEAGLADALDLLVICADSGLSLEAGLTRMASEMQKTQPAISQEILLTAQEMRISGNLRDALNGLGGRTGLDSLKRLASTLIQTLQYGTPLTQALRTLSAELRQEQLTRFEERAARLPVLLTVPMIVFILPCVFLIVGGPAIIELMKAI